MEQPYRTLLARGDDEFIINKSRFIGHALPCATEQAALEFIAELRREYKDASHNCYAYVIGRNKGTMRYSDDGEPSGTAGMPIMEVLKNRDLTDCCIVVTRYFGGVLLGAGGLVRAYTQGAVVATDAARMGVMYPSQTYMLDVAYTLLGRLEHFLSGTPYRLGDKEFGASVTVEVTIKSEWATGFMREMARISDGRLEPIMVEETFLPWQA